MGSVWHNLRRGLGRLRDRRPAVALQPVGLSATDMKALLPVLHKVGEQLALRLELRGDDSEIVLLDADHAGATPQQKMQALQRGRPVVLVAGSDSIARSDSRLLSAAEHFERCQQELLQQLKQITLVRNQSVHWGAAGWSLDAAPADNPPSLPPPATFISAFDSDFDSRLDADELLPDLLDSPRRDFVERVLVGMHDSQSPALTASYAPGACLRFDFAARIVMLDTQAQRCLRVQRELPRPTPGARPQADAVVRELDETIWDLGLASGNFALLDAPQDWWHTPLLGPAASQVERFSRMPRHLELARQLVAGPTSPSALRKNVRVSVSDLRRFLQACLFLGLVHWDTAGVPR
jgi:hypothetical protein